MPLIGDLPLLANPLHTTTAEIYNGWQKEAERLQKRLRDLAWESLGEPDGAGLETEGLHARLKVLRELLEKATIINAPPELWRRETDVVRPGILVRLELEEGCRDFVPIRIFFNDFLIFQDCFFVPFFPIKNFTNPELCVICIFRFREIFNYFFKPGPRAVKVSLVKRLLGL